MNQAVQERPRCDDERVAGVGIPIFHRQAHYAAVRNLDATCFAKQPRNTWLTVQRLRDPLPIAPLVGLGAR
jgi:hypothetical protein